MDAGGLLGGMLRDPLVSVTAAVVIALVFAQSLLHKLQDFTRFSSALAAYRLLPPALVAPGAGRLAAAGAGVVVLLLGPAGRAAGAAAAAALLGLYAAAMTVNLARGRTDLDCGCGGEPQPLHWGLVLRNGLLATGALPAAWPPVARPLDGFDLFAVAAAGIGLWGLTRVADELMRQGRRLAALRAAHPRRTA